MEIIKLNLIPSGVNPTCHCSQYDNGRVIRIDLFDGLTPYVLQSGDTVTLNVRKPDNHIVTTTLTATQGNTYVNLVTTEQICACVGYNLCDLTITNGTTVIGTLNFIMQIERDVLADGIPSQSQIDDLDELVQEAVGDNYYTKSETNDLLDNKADSDEVYTKQQVDDALAEKANVTDLPDMSDYYTKTQVDADLALKANISILNSGNIAPKTAAGSRTSNDVTYTSDGNGNIIANGTASSTSYYLFYNNQSALPPMFEAGKTYFCDYWSDDIAITINVNAYNSNGDVTTVLDTAFSKKFTLPSDTVGLVCRIKIGTGHKATNRLITPRFYTIESLEYARLRKDKNPQPMLSIIYDDGLEEFNTYIMPIIQAKKIPIASAVVPESVGSTSFMDWSTIKSCYENGAEILTHFNAYSESEWNELGTQAISTRFYKSLNAIRSNGIFTSPAFVFAGSSSRYTVARAAAYRIFKAGFNASNGGINKYGEIDPYFINRYGTDGKTLNELKAWIDDLIASKTGWAVWTRHNSNASGEDPVTAATILSDVIDYALENGVQIVTVERGLAEYLDIN